MLRRSQTLRRSRQPRTAILEFALVALVALLAACGGKSSGESSANDPSATAKAPAPTAWQIVALGDSETTGEGDETGLGWVERYARLLRQTHREKVNVTNLAQNGQTSSQLLAQVRSDPATRSEIERATIVLLGTGGADLDAGDAAQEAGSCRGKACYAPVLRDFGRNLDATVTAIRKLRGAKPTVFRAITWANVVPGAQDVIPPFVTLGIGLYQSRTQNRKICQAMAKHGGRCIDALRTFNGPRGTENAYRKGLLNHDDCCYPTAKGQQLMAELLIDTGLAPLQ